MWYMYVVQCSDETLYTGITTDIQRRIREHNHSKRGAKYTRRRRPTKIILLEPHPDRSSAMRAENKFKRLTRKQKEEKINENR